MFAYSGERYGEPAPTTERAVNVYTMDHRGTGRSTKLDCVATQVTTTGTLWGNDLVASEVPAQDLQFKYGDLASFSVTTAATDLTTFISKYSNGTSTIVYGVSYGTVLVERLIHLAPPEVTGYVLDGIATSSGAPADEFMYMSEFDSNFGEAGDAFLALCEEDSGCKAHFESKRLNDTVQDLLTQFDKDPNSTCASLITHVESKGLDGLPSSSLRFTLGTLLKDSYMRTLIPPIVYRLDRCASKDINVLKKFVMTLSNSLDSTSQDDAYLSNVLFYLIVFSEMWEIPTPSKAEMKARYSATKVSDDPTYPMDPVYCAFSKEKSAFCEEFGVGSHDANPPSCMRVINTGTRVLRFQVTRASCC